MDVPSSENVCLAFYFADFIFAVCQSTAKIGSLENFRLYGIAHWDHGCHAKVKKKMYSLVLILYTRDFFLSTEKNAHRGCGLGTRLAQYIPYSLKFSRIKYFVVWLNSAQKHIFADKMFVVECESRKVHTYVYNKY